MLKYFKLNKIKEMVNWGKIMNIFNKGYNM